MNVTHVKKYTLFFLKMLFPYNPLESTEKNSLCHTAGSYLFSILFTVHVEETWYGKMRAALERDSALSM